MIADDTHVAFPRIEKKVLFDERLDRQLRIQGWDQSAVDRARIGVVGDNDLLASMYVLSSAALGINDVVVIAPILDDRLVDVAKQVNPRLRVMHLEGFYTHPLVDDIFKRCDLIVDLCRYGLANKLLLERGYRKNIPIIRGFSFEENGEQGFKVFTYIKGREWQELEQMISPSNLPDEHFDDAVFDMIVSGIVLEATKNVVMNKTVSENIIFYKRKKLNSTNQDQRILVTGSGALGVFVGLGLASTGFRHSTFMDPDVTETTNLNRQVLLYNAVGRSKAETLAQRLNLFFNTNAQSRIEYFKKHTDIVSYDVIFDCVDNFESRIVMSETCRDHNKIMISGGTDVDAGQVVTYNPKEDEKTPAELLGLYDVVDQRNIVAPERVRASCKYRPDPSVVMTNQIVAGFMVDSYRMLLDGEKPHHIFYHSKSSEMI
jgi:molybdopterin/thiamine biosynthesis adenylyltransferase